MKHKAKFPTLENKAILAPMAGVTDVAFRALAKKYGAALTYTEFVSSSGLIRNAKSLLDQIRTDPSEQPVGIQLFGSNLNEIVEAARMFEDRFNIIDINCGCPAWKVMRIGAGADLLKSTEGVSKVVNAVASAVNCPVTIKIRKGIDDNHINAVEVAKAAEDSGAAAITVHGRTAAAGYSGVADWDIIRRVKDAVNIPVIGNGDISTPKMFKEKLVESGVDYVMVGRGAMGNPGLFQEINEYMINEVSSIPDVLSRIPSEVQWKEYLVFAEKYHIEFSSISSQAMHFTKGLPFGSSLRQNISQAKTKEELLKIMDSIGHIV